MSNTVSTRIFFPAGGGGGNTGRRVRPAWPSADWFLTKKKNYGHSGKRSATARPTAAGQEFPALRPPPPENRPCNDQLAVQPTIIITTIIQIKIILKIIICTFIISRGFVTISTLFRNNNIMYRHGGERTSARARLLCGTAAACVRVRYKFDLIFFFMLWEKLPRRIRYENVRETHSRPNTVHNKRVITQVVRVLRDTPRPGNIIDGRNTKNNV